MGIQNQDHKPWPNWDRRPHQPGSVPTEWKDSDEGGKESENGHGGCVVGGGGVDGRRQGQWSVRESEEGSEGEWGCWRTVRPAAGKTMVA